MVVPTDPEEVYYGDNVCNHCGEELDEDETEFDVCASCLFFLSDDDRTIEDEFNTDWSAY